MDNAMGLIAQPPWSQSRMFELFVDTANDALSYGLTAVHDAGLSPLAVPLLQL